MAGGDFGVKAEVRSAPAANKAGAVNTTDRLFVILIGDGSAEERNQDQTSKSLPTQQDDKMQWFRKQKDGMWKELCQLPSGNVKVTLDKGGGITSCLPIRDKIPTLSVHMTHQFVGVCLETNEI